MKFLHTSDLHIGKKIRAVSQSDNQKDILRKISALADEENVDAVVIAGDVYDTANPSAEAVAILDDFLVEVSRRHHVLLIPGNHDSAEKLSFGSRLMNEHMHIVGSFSGTAVRCSLPDARGQVDFYLLPYINPEDVRYYYPDEPVRTPDDGFRVVLAHSGIDPSARNVLVCHQFVAKGGSVPEGSGSEIRVAVGGDECVSSEVMDDFDYVALGHIHKHQKAGRDTIRYCGTPLKYSSSEAHDIKGVEIVEMGGKGEVSYRHVPLKPLHDLVVIEGDLEQLVEKAKAVSPEDQVEVVLTAPAEKARETLQNYCNVIGMTYRIESRAGEEADVSLEELSRTDPKDLFSRFFMERTGHGMDEDQAEFFAKALEASYREVSD